MVWRENAFILFLHQLRTICEGGIDLPFLQFLFRFPVVYSPNVNGQPVIVCVFDKSFTQMFRLGLISFA